MQLIKKLKNGTEYYRMDDGRFGAIYPSTGYARVSYAIDKKNDGRAMAQRNRNYDAYRQNRIGQELKYQINPVVKTEEYHEIALPLYYDFFDKKVQYQNEWRKAYYKMETKKRVLYPGDRQKLYDLLQAFNRKNCK
jgi:hypothetical protein